MAGTNLGPATPSNPCTLCLATIHSEPAPDGELSSLRQQIELGMSLQLLQFALQTYLDLITRIRPCFTTKTYHHVVVTASVASSTHASSSALNWGIILAARFPLRLKCFEKNHTRVCLSKSGDHHSAIPTQGKKSPPTGGLFSSSCTVVASRLDLEAKQRLWRGMSPFSHAKGRALHEKDTQQETGCLGEDDHLITVEPSD